MDWQALQHDSEAYWTRNTGQHHQHPDPIEETLDRIHRHTSIRDAFEAGASDGWRLHWMQAKYGCRVQGIDASASAVKQASVPVRHGIAPFSMEQLSEDAFDLVILGFFAYLLHRSQSLRLAAAVDKILRPGGHLVIVDFLSPYPTRADYAHHPGLAVWKQDLSALWTGSPQWTLVDRTLIEHQAHDVDNADPARWITVDAIRKLPTDLAWADIEPPRSRTA